MALEGEKTQLLNQICQLKRLVDQHDDTGTLAQSIAQTTQSTAAITTTQLEPKKRKYNTIYAMQTISDSSDEGLGSMSPEPTTVTFTSSSTATAAVANTATVPKPANGVTSVNAKEMIEMKSMLDMERRKNAALEDRLRQMTECHPSTIYTNGDRITYEQHEVIEHTNNLRHGDDEQQVHTVLVDKVHHNLQNLHVVALDTGRSTFPLHRILIIRTREFGPYTHTHVNTPNTLNL